MRISDWDSPATLQRPQITFSDGGIFLAASNEERAADCAAEEDDHELKIYDSILAGEFEKKDNPKAFFDVHIHGVQGADDNLRRISRRR